MLERKIIIGLITSTQFIKNIRPIWDAMLLESSTARLIAGWCIQHFDKYQKAPNKEIEIIFFKKVESGLDEEIAEEIEEEILPDLSDEYEENNIDLDFLIPETKSYLKARQLKIHAQQILNTLENGNGDVDACLKEAEEIKSTFKLINTEPDQSIDLSAENIDEEIEKAFMQNAEPIIKFPKQLGKFWNDQFIAGGFISFLAPEKRGKTWLLLEIAIRAVKQNKKIAFFQAGDMNKSEQLKRIGIYLCKKSNLEKYCKEHYQPTRDCLYNQTNECDKDERECDFGVFEDLDIHQIKELTIKELKESYELNTDYKPCYNCRQYDILKLGVPWLKKIPKVEPIDHTDVTKKLKQFLAKTKGQFKLDTYANGTLTVNQIINVLDMWQDSSGFIPDIILIDYADLLVPSIKSEFRHQQNSIWKELRKLSQTPRNNILPLVISPTQADGKSYKTHTLELDNYSEDKRKYAHATAFYGLNQDPYGREKGLSLMRINELLLREGEYHSTNQVTLLLDLYKGRPFIGSYFGS